MKPHWPGCTPHAACKGLSAWEECLGLQVLSRRSENESRRGLTEHRLQEIQHWFWRRQNQQGATCFACLCPKLLLPRQPAPHPAHSGPFVPLAGSPRAEARQGACANQVTGLLCASSKDKGKVETMSRFPLVPPCHSQGRQKCSPRLRTKI